MIDGTKPRVTVSKSIVMLQPNRIVSYSLMLCPKRFQEFDRIFKSRIFEITKADMASPLVCSIIANEVNRDLFSFGISPSISEVMAMLDAPLTIPNSIVLMAAVVINENGSSSRIGNIIIIRLNAR